MHWLLLCIHVQKWTHNTGTIFKTSWSDDKSCRSYIIMSHVEFQSSLKTISTSTPLQTCKFIVVLSTEMCWALTYIILQTCLNSSPVFDLLFFLLSVNSDINDDSYSPKCGQLRWKWWFLTHWLLPTITILAHNWQNGCHVFLPM